MLFSPSRNKNSEEKNLFENILQNYSEKSIKNIPKPKKNKNLLEFFNKKLSVYFPDIKMPKNSFLLNNPYEIIDSLIKNLPQTKKNSTTYDSFLTEKAIQNQESRIYRKMKKHRNFDIYDEISKVNF